MIGDEIKLKFLAQLKFGIKMGSLIFMEFPGYKPVAEPAGVIPHFSSLGTLFNGLFRFQAYSCITPSPGYIPVFIPNK